MNNWNKCPQLPSETGDSYDILKVLFEEKERLFSIIKNGTLKTQLIKKALRVLGEQKGYKAWANGQQLPNDGSEARFVNREWLYDIHWYSDEDYFFPTDLQMAGECEWRSRMEKWTVRDGEYYRNDGKDKPYSAVMFDFQKLLVTNAALRLMIFKVRKVDDLLYMQEYFENAIQKYKRLCDGDKFLIIAYHMKARDIYYIQLEKRPE